MKYKGMKQNSQAKEKNTALHNCNMISAAWRLIVQMQQRRKKVQGLEFGAIVECMSFICHSLMTCQLNYCSSLYIYL